MLCENNVFLSAVAFVFLILLLAMTYGGLIIKPIPGATGTMNGSAVSRLFISSLAVIMLIEVYNIIRFT